MINIVEYLHSLSTQQLKEIQNIIGDIVSAKLNKSPAPETIPAELNINDYVSYLPGFISDVEKQILSAELASMPLPRISPNKVTTQFVSNLHEPYTWQSRNGPVVNKPLDINNFPGLKNLLNRINGHVKCDLNSVLVSVQPTGNASISLHDDDEIEMDSKSPICVVSIGAKRKVEFVNKLGMGYKNMVLSLEPEDMSMYIMQTGCQSYFLHKLCKDKHVKNLRVSLSFRRFAPQPDLIPPTVGNINQMTETTSTLPPLQGTLVGRWSTLICLLASLAACVGRV